MKILKRILFIPTAILVWLIFYLVLLYLWLIFWNFLTIESNVFLANEFIASCLCSIPSMFVYYITGLAILGNDEPHKNIGNILLCIAMSIYLIVQSYFSFQEDEYQKGIVSIFNLLVCIIGFIHLHKAFRKI
ncbi:MAG: hypothetical protein Q4A00_07085 [Flavobacteriaceae bacterium]|nr:hypothetical protein [Flavobacteriaceae bacterium]